MDFERRDVYYSGRVQGVGFRYNAQRIATGFDVTGYVQNLSDGRVWLVVEGKPGEIGSLMRSIEDSMRSNIDNVESSSDDYVGEFEGFSIRR